MCTNIAFEGKDHSPVQKRWHCWVTLAGEGWCWRTGIATRVRLCRSGLVRSGIPMGKIPDTGSQRWLYPCPAAEPLLATARAQLTAISVIQMVTLGVVTMDKFSSFSDNTRVSPFSPACNATGKSESRTHEHSTSSLQMPTKPCSSRCHFPGMTGEIKAVTSVVPPRAKSRHCSCWRSLDPQHNTQCQRKAEPPGALQHAHTQTGFFGLKPPRPSEGPALMGTILPPGEHVSNKTYSKGFGIVFPAVLTRWSVLRLLSGTRREGTGLPRRQSTRPPRLGAPAVTQGPMQTWEERSASPSEWDGKDAQRLISLRL